MVGLADRLPAAVARLPQVREQHGLALNRERPPSWSASPMPCNGRIVSRVEFTALSQQPCPTPAGAANGECASNVFPSAYRRYSPTTLRGTPTAEIGTRFPLCAGMLVAAPTRPTYSPVVPGTLCATWTGCRLPPKRDGPVIGIYAHRLLDDTVAPERPY